jgi:hypothetical protein
MSCQAATRLEARNVCLDSGPASDRLNSVSNRPYTPSAGTPRLTAGVLLTAPAADQAAGRRAHTLSRPAVG